jgi:filamentous hemagglutinin family protein
MAGMQRTLLLLSLFSLVRVVVVANPQEPVVVSGQASFEQSGAQLSVTAGDKAIINWKDFSIDSGELTKFIQPGASSVVVNRVVGGLPSSIFGTLEATGKVFLVNPGGIIIGESGIINTAAFIATTLDFSNLDLLDGKELLFMGDSAASIVNLGMVSAWDGDILLIAKTVENRGELFAQNGTVALAAGKEILMKPMDQERIFIRPQSEISSAEVTNSGTISALQVELKAEGNPYSFAINQTGTIDAASVAEKEGRIFLVSEKGKVHHDGMMTNEGDLVLISGSHVQLDNGDEPGSIKASGSLAVRANQALFVDQGFSIHTEEGAVSFESLQGDVSLFGHIKSAGDLSIYAGEDLKVGSGQQPHHSRLESVNGNINITAGRDISLAASDTKAAQITAQSSKASISLIAGQDITLMGGKETLARALVFSKGNLSAVAGRHLKMDSSGAGYAGLGAANELTVVVDNLFPEPPTVGTGALIMGPNTRMQGGNLRIFTAKQSLNTIEGVLNQAPFFPSPQDAGSTEEMWGTYYSGDALSVGSPYIIYYKDFWVNPRVTDLFIIATTEFLQDLKDFDDFFYYQRCFCLRFAKKAFEKLQTKDKLSSPEIFADRCYRFLQPTYKNSGGKIREMF